MKHPSQQRPGPSTASVINEFFAIQASRSASDATQDRRERIRRHLFDFLESADVSGYLDPHELSLLAAARRRGGGALAVIGPSQLVACLPAFITGDWLLPHRADARMQIAVTGRLVTWLDRAGHLDEVPADCAVHTTLAAVRDAASARGSGPGQGAPRRHLMLIRGGLDPR